MMGIAIPYAYFREKPEEGPNVLFHGTDIVQAIGNSRD
jgi:hypothetical protein